MNLIVVEQDDRTVVWDATPETAAKLDLMIRAAQPEWVEGDPAPIIEFGDAVTTRTVSGRTELVVIPADRIADQFTWDGTDRTATKIRQALEQRGRTDDWDGLGWVNGATTIKYRDHNGEPNLILRGQRIAVTRLGIVELPTETP